MRDFAPTDLDSSIHNVLRYSCYQQGSTSISAVDALPKLPPTIARHTVFLLMESLPPPLTEAPEERAARAVAADARATECLRLASLPKLYPDRVDQCIRQANAMMRASEAALRSLRAMQTARERTEAAAQLAPALAPPPAGDSVAEADRFARRRPKEAGLIRRLGRLPNGLAPMAPEVVQVIITGATPALRALDRPADEAIRRAA